MRSNTYINGSTGFLGSAYADYYKPMTFGHKSVDFPCLLESVDSAKLKNFLKTATTIVHFEAYGANNDYLDHIESLQKLKKVIECSPHNSKLVYISSASVYASSEYKVMDEDSKLDMPKTLYLQTKLIGEKMVQDYCHNYTILRVGNVVGPGLRHGVIANLMKHKPEDSVEVFSTFPGDYRVFVHIDTVCDMIYECTKSNISDRQIINVAGIGEVSIFDILKIMKLTPSKFIDSPKEYVIPDNDKMFQMFPHIEVTGSIDIIRRALKENGYPI